MFPLRKKATVKTHAALQELRRALARRSGLGGFVDVMMGAGVVALAFASVAGVLSPWLPSLEVFGNLQVHIAALLLVMVLAGLLARSHGWSVAAAGLVLVNAVSIGVRIAPVETCRIQMAATQQQAVRVLTHNVWRHNRDFEALRDLLDRQRPDVILLQEVRRYHEPQLEKLRPQYPYRVGCDRYLDCDVTILSRHPLEPGKEVGDHEGLLLETAVTIGGHRLVLLGTHIVQPVPGQEQSAEFRELTRVVSAMPGNALIAGDFNSVPWSPNMARYVRDSGVCASNATQATWPQWLGRFGVPIDHIFLKPDLRLLSIATLDGTGSDHKALLATIGVR